MKENKTSLIQKEISDLQASLSEKGRKVSKDDVLLALIREARKAEFKIKLIKSWTVSKAFKSIMAEEKERMGEVLNEENVQKIIASFREKLKETVTYQKENSVDFASKNKEQANEMTEENV